MNTKLLGIMAALVVVIGAMIFLTREPAPAPSTASTPESAATPAASFQAAAPAPEPTQAPITTQTTPATTEAGLPVLATVNGVQITEKDLSPGGEPRQAKIDQAIDRELIVQEASARGVTLTPEQQKLLAQLPEGVANTAAFDGGKAPEAEARMQSEIDFRMRDATAQFLLSTLATSSTEPAPQALSTQEQRLRDYLNRLRAAAKIETGSSPR